MNRDIKRWGIYIISVLMMFTMLNSCKKSVDNKENGEDDIAQALLEAEKDQSSDAENEAGTNANTTSTSNPVGKVDVEKDIALFIRDNKSFVDEEGATFVATTQSDGFTFYKSYSEIDRSNKNDLIDDDHYVDSYSCLKEKSELNEVLRRLSGLNVNRLDYNESLIAYKTVDSNSLFIYDRVQETTNEITDVYSFFHVIEDQVLYQYSSENPGVYLYQDEKEEQLSEFNVVDAMYYEGILYFIDKDDLFYSWIGNERQCLSSSTVMEYIFDEDFVIVCVYEDRLHVVYKVIEDKLEFVRPLTLETVANFDWFFSDGKTFYYNGSYEIPFTFSTSLDIGQSIGEVIYEDDHVVISHFSHTNYEFASSTVQLYFKNENRHINIGQNLSVSNWRVIDNQLFMIGNRGVHEAGKVYKIDLDSYETELVKDYADTGIDEMSDSGILMDYHPTEDIAVFNNAKEVITSTDREELFLESDEYYRTKIIYVGDEKCYYIVDNKEIYCFDYETHQTTLMDSIDSKYESEFRFVKMDGNLTYQGLQHTVKQLNYSTQKIVTLASNCKEMYLRKVGSSNYYIGTDNHLYRIKNQKSTRISDVPVMDDQDMSFSDRSIAEIGNDVYYIQKSDNTIKVYHEDTNTWDSLDAFWIEGRLIHLESAVLKGEPILYVYAGPSRVGERYLRYPFNEAVYQEKLSDGEIIEDLGLLEFGDYTFVDGGKDYKVFGTKDKVDPSVNYNYSIYQMKTKKVIPLPYFAQMVEKMEVTNGTLTITFNGLNPKDDFKYFPYTEMYDLATGSMIDHNPFLQLGQYSKRFDLGNNSSAIQLKEVVLSKDSFTFDFVKMKDSVFAEGLFCPNIRIDQYSDRHLMIIMTGLAEYDESQFQKMRKLSFVESVKVTKYQSKVYLEFQLNGAQQFTGRFTQGEDDFMDVTFQFE